MEQYVITSLVLTEIRAQLKEIKSKIETRPSLNNTANQVKQRALVIAGEALVKVQEIPKLKDDFL